MARKRGELPTPAEATIEMGLKDGWVCIDIEHRWDTDRMKPSGKIKRTYVKLMNTFTGEKTIWLRKHIARKEYGEINKKRVTGYKHTDKTVAKKVQELTNGNAELISWWRGKGSSSNVIYAQIKYKCGCIIKNQIEGVRMNEDCPICSAKWKTEDAVCKIVEQYVQTMDDKDIDITAHRQETVHMNIDGKRVARRFDMVVKLRHKYDKNIVRWIVVEYNGECHYKPINYGNLEEDVLMEAFKQYRQRDAHKRKFCEELNIPMIVIPYWKKNNIEEIIENQLVPLIYEKAFWIFGRYIQEHSDK